MHIKMWDLKLIGILRIDVDTFQWKCKKCDQDTQNLKSKQVQILHTVPLMAWVFFLIMCIYEEGTII